jgi:hypothetical protein
MTIKQWLYEHKNVTLILLAFVTLANMQAWYSALVDLRWGWLVFFTLTTAIMISYTVKWWEEEQ